MLVTLKSRGKIWYEYLGRLTILILLLAGRRNDKIHEKHIFSLLLCIITSIPNEISDSLKGTNICYHLFIVQTVRNWLCNQGAWTTFVQWIEKKFSIQLEVKSDAHRVGFVCILIKVRQKQSQTKQYRKTWIARWSMQCMLFPLTLIPSQRDTARSGRSARSVLIVLKTAMPWKPNKMAARFMREIYTKVMPRTAN